MGAQTQGQVDRRGTLFANRSAVVVGQEHHRQDARATRDTRRG